MTTNFPDEHARSLLIKYLQTHHEGAVDDAINGAARKATEIGLYTKPPRRNQTNYPDLSSEDESHVPELIRQLLWQLLIQGIIVFGKSNREASFYYYRVTEYGKEVLAQNTARPYDPEGFLCEFKKVNPDADDTVVEYLAEAIHTFNTNCFKAAAVMLGCASEQLILVLVDTFRKAIADPSENEKFTKSLSQPIKTKFNTLRKALDGMIDNRQFAEDRHKEFKDITISLSSVFELIRQIRNAAGHPELPSNLRRETIYQNLTIFPEYARQTLRLIEYFNNNPAYA